METNKKLKTLIWAVIILVIVNLASLAFIWQKSFSRKRNHKHHSEMDHHKDGKDPFVEELKKQIGWTDEQITKVNELKKIKFKNIEEIRDSIPKVKKELLAEIYKTPVDTAKINQLTGKLGEFQSRIEYNFFMHFTDFAGVSTPQQKEKMREYFDAAILRENSHSGNHEDAPAR